MAHELPKHPLRVCGNRKKVLHDLMHNFCHPEAKLETLSLPSTLKMEDRERFEEVKNAESVSTMIHNAHRVLKQELQSRCSCSGCVKPSPLCNF
jgi:hypothetical protein